MSLLFPVPELDPRDEDQMVAEAVDALPADLSDRNAAAPHMKLLEAVGALYAVLLYNLNQWPMRVRVWILNLLGVTPQEGTRATLDSLVFVCGDAGATIKQGTVVKTDTTIDAVRFVVDEDHIIPNALPVTVSATARDVGAKGNVNAMTLTYLDTPILGVESVFNTLPATGGSDPESVDAAEQRTRLAQRTRENAVNADDFTYHAERIPQVARAKSACSRGTATIHILTDELNERASTNVISPTDNLIREAVKTDALNRCMPSTFITINQGAIRLVRISRLEIKLLPYAKVSEVRAAITKACASHVSALPVYDVTGTILHEPWGWGEPLYSNDLIGLIDAIDGVKRVGQIWTQYSDDYGATWSAEEAAQKVDPALSGLVTLDFGMLHYDDGLEPVIDEL